MVPIVTTRAWNETNSAMSLPTAIATAEMHCVWPLAMPHAKVSPISLSCVAMKASHDGVELPAGAVEEPAHDRVGDAAHDEVPPPVGRPGSGDV